MKRIKYIKTLFFGLTLTGLSFKSNAQTYQYLKIIVDSAYNLDIVEMDWIANNVNFPQTAMTGWNSPTPLEVTGDRANWERTQLYDNTVADCRVGNVELSSHVKHEFTLNLGVGNNILPDSLLLQKTSYGVLAKFRVLLSTNNVDWHLFLDTTIQSSNWIDASFPLKRVKDLVPPSKPLNLHSSHKNSNSIYLEWQKSTDNFFVNNYHIYLDGNLIDSTRNNYYLSRKLNPNTAYSFFIHAVDGDRNFSIASDTIKDTTHVLDIEKPLLKGRLMPKTICYDKVTLEWSQAQDNVGLSGYLISVNNEFTEVADTNFITLCGLVPETEYNIDVVAKDLSGNRSNIISTKVKTQAYMGGMKLGTNFWRQQWSPDNNQLFNNGYQNVDEENPWKEQLIEDLSYAETLRFMEMQQINIGPLNNWLERQRKEDLEQEDLAYEWMIDLCNRTKKNLWICIPWNVVDSLGVTDESNGLIVKLAILLKTGVDMGDIELNEDSIGPLNQLTAKDFMLLGGKKTTEPLDPSLKIFLEYSNENWNWNFPQASYCRDHGIARGFGPGALRALKLFSAYGSLESFKEFAKVFGKDAERIEKVLPIQRTDLFYTYYSFVDVFDNIGFNPDTIYPNIVSGATYFSNQRDGDDPNIFSIMENDINDYITLISEFKDSMSSWGNQRNTNFKMISYEGGHHVNTNYDSINTDSNIYHTYLHFLDTMSYYFEEIELYNHVARNAFGLKSYINQPLEDAHKFRAVLDWRKNTKPDVIYSSIQGEMHDSNAVVNWSTNKEFSSLPGFVIWHSSDGINFDSIAYKESLSGTNPPSLYSFTDSNAILGLNYYMVSQKSAIGQVIYSKIVVLAKEELGNTQINKLAKQVLLYPNPTKGMVHLNLSKNDKKQVAILFASNGEKLMYFNQVPERIDLSSLPIGIYYLRLKNQTIKIMKL